MDERTPTICADRATWSAYSLFNPNEWRVESRAVVSSCAAQFGLLLHTVGCARNEIANGTRACELRLEDLRVQWQMGRWEIGRGRYLVEVPTVHLQVQAFLVTGKTLLDLLAQLASTEGLVIKKVHGFHKKGSAVGGELLHMLSNRASRGKENQASALRAFLESEKTVWIDNLVRARDDLAHPQRGMLQVMWEIQLAESGDGLRADCVVPPHIANLPFDKYVEAPSPRLSQPPRLIFGL